MNEKDLLVKRIENGIVIDHIPAGNASLVISILRPDKDATVIIATNIKSKKYGKKDIIKIEGRYLTTDEINLISLVAPTATINLINDWAVSKKRNVVVPDFVEGIFECPNPSCPTNVEIGMLKTKFDVVASRKIENIRLECSFCDSVLYHNSIIDTLSSEKISIRGGLVSKKKIEKTVLDVLIKKGSLRIPETSDGFFVLKSGRKSPYFINVGRLTDGESLSKLKWALGSYINLLLEEGKIEDFDFIFGPAYKGINLTVLACEGLNELYKKNKRYLYDRKEVKDYGDKSSDKVIVGASHFKKGQKILLIDDVVSTGRTKIESIKKLKLLDGHKIVGMILVVDRQEKMGNVKKVENKSPLDFISDELGIQTHSILSMENIFHMVKEQINQDVKQKWVEYSEKYGTVKLN